jgi:hypothetical protein
MGVAMMTLPFTPEQFFDLFKSYNEAVWPAPVALTAVAAVAVFSALSRRAWARRAAFIALAVLWLWTGLVYQLAFFARINPAARIFAGIWLVGALLFLRRGSLRAVGAPAPDGMARIMATLFVVYALAAYPLLLRASGHVFPAAPTFGTPCPVTILTLGVLLVEDAAWPLFVAPLLWCAIGGSAAFLFGLWADAGLLAAGIVTVMLLWRRRQRRHAAA